MAKIKLTDLSEVTEVEPTDLLYLVDDGDKKVTAMNIAMKGKINSGAQIYNNANTQILDRTDTALTFNSEVYDTDNYHSTSSDTGRIYAPATGIYMVLVSLHWSSDNSGGRRGWLRHQGGTILNQSTITGYGNLVANSFLSLVNLTEGEYFEVWVRQWASATLDIYYSWKFSNFVTIRRLA